MVTKRIALPILAVAAFGGVAAGCAVGQVGSETTNGNASSGVTATGNPGGQSLASGGRGAAREANVPSGSMARTRRPSRLRPTAVRRAHPPRLGRRASRILRAISSAIKDRRTSAFRRTRASQAGPPIRRPPFGSRPRARSSSTQVVARRGRPAAARAEHRAPVRARPLSPRAAIPAEEAAPEGSGRRFFLADTKTRRSP
jgi:hypothetical protein